MTYVGSRTHRTLLLARPARSFASCKLFLMAFRRAHAAPRGATSHSSAMHKCAVGRVRATQSHLLCDPSNLEQAPHELRGFDKNAGLRRTPGQAPRPGWARTTAVTSSPAPKDADDDPEAIRQRPLIHFPTPGTQLSRPLRGTPPLSRLAPPLPFSRGLHQAPTSSQSHPGFRQKGVATTCFPLCLRRFVSQDAGGCWRARAACGCLACLLLSAGRPESRSAQGLTQRAAQGCESRARKVYLLPCSTPLLESNVADPPLPHKGK